MKYLHLPLKLLKFWYPESWTVFLRVLKNLLIFLEEELAVGLMVKLILVPLFHDSSVFGRTLSFLFRSFRIVFGTLALVVATNLTMAAMVFWFASPVLAVVTTGWLGWLAKGVLFSGVVLFVQHILANPHIKIKQIPTMHDVWQSTLLNRKDLDFAKLVKSERVKNLLTYLELTPDQVQDFVHEYSEEDVLKKAWELGRNLKADYLTEEHFFVAMLFCTRDIVNQLIKLGLKPTDFVDALEYIDRKNNQWKIAWLWDDDFHVKHLKGINRGWLGVPTPALDAVSEDLTQKASRERIPDFIGRVKIIDEVVRLLSMEKGRNVMVVGEPGSGRTELVLYLSKLIVAGDAPDTLATKRVVRLDFARLLSGVTTQGELAERVKNIFEEVKFHGGVILFIDEIQDLALGEAGGQFNLLSMMLPYIEGSDFQFLATTEPGNFSHILERNGSFIRLFTKVELPQATVDETISILKDRAIEQERYKKVKTSLVAMRKIAELSKQYIHNLVLPDGALQVYQECLVSAKDRWVTKTTAEVIIQSRVGVPIGETQVKEQSGKLLNLEQIMHSRLIGQDEAVTAIANTLRRSATDLRDQNRPVGSFLFVGPTGVGKTETAKVLMETYFETRGNFLRLDMSEYQSEDAVDRLIGSSAQEGVLTETVRQKPFTLLLLDEFEKANPKVWTLFLQVLDDGRLTSGRGVTVDFTNTIIIATSNIASVSIAQGIEAGEAPEELKQQVNDELITVFKPELVNRFDDIVVFRPLTQDQLQQIVRIKLEGLKKHMEQQGYLVEFEEKLASDLATRGYDQVLGARPLRRLIQDTLEAKMSEMILKGELKKGEKFVAGEQLLN